MRVTTVPTYQGHAVPSTVSRPNGPFPPELLAHEPIITDYEPDDGGYFEPGATAQNAYQPVRYFQCRFCEEQMTEHETTTHYCEQSN